MTLGVSAPRVALPASRFCRSSVSDLNCIFMMVNQKPKKQKQ
jgi:hypothetical protein